MAHFRRARDHSLRDDYWPSAERAASLGKLAGARAPACQDTIARARARYIIRLARVAHATARSWPRSRRSCAPISPAFVSGRAPPDSGHQFGAEYANEPGAWPPGARRPGDKNLNRVAWARQLICGSGRRARARPWRPAGAPEAAGRGSAGPELARSLPVRPGDESRQDRCKDGRALGARP